MGLEALLTRLESRVVTPALPAVTPDATAKPLPIKDCTAVTPVTAVNTISRSVAERPAITKPEGASPQDWADSLARLQAMIRPADISRERWALLQADAAQFANQWSRFAASLGWQPAMVYTAPGGLVPWIDGGDILAICERSAVIRTTDRRQVNCWRYDRLTGEEADKWRCWSSWNEPKVS